MTVDKLIEIRNSVKEQRPLIHCITNPISINQCANAILAVGCCPIMAEHLQEVGEITSTAQALLINLGNITDVRMKSMMISAEIAKEKKIPCVIDLVGVACSELRREFAYEFVKKKSPTLIKGNYSEINAMYNSAYKSVGIDSELSLDVGNIANIAVALAQKYNTIILASGKIDVITDGEKIIYIQNGTAELANITGTGCMLGMLSACYLSACRDMAAVATACAVLGISGELSKNDKGNGSFMVNLMDSLSVLSDKDIRNYIKMEVRKIEKI